jgi:hypothetical protein
MDLSMTQNGSTTMLESVGPGLQMCFIVPELIAIAFLLLAIYGMYQGIEVQHPLYAILFFNLIVSLISSIINTTVFGFISLDKYVRVSNVTNGFSIYFHGTCWLLSSFIRYVYILHKDWLFSKVPDVKKQCWIALGLEITLVFMFMLPVLGTLILLGNTNNKLHLLPLFTLSQHKCLCLFTICVSYQLVC